MSCVGPRRLAGLALSTQFTSKNVRMEYRFLQIQVTGAVASIQMNRPERRNALSLELMREFIAALDAVAARAGVVRAVVIEAAGDVFSSGHDLRELTGRGAAEYRELFDVCTELMRKIQSIPQPVIAQVQGVATAAGCQLVCTCDLAVASDKASFATPGVKIGLFCTTPMVALTRAVGRKRAMEMLLTGRAVDAATAADWGIVNRVVAAGELAAETRKLAEAIAESSALTVGIGKSAFYAQVDLEQSKAYAHAKEAMSRNALEGDAQEGITAFLEKRAACWAGR